MCIYSYQVIITFCYKFSDLIIKKYSNKISNCMVDLLRSATIILASFALMFLFIIYFYNLIVDGSLI